MKAAKQQKKQSIWDQVKNEEKDFYFNYLSKKSRNLQKKLKDIADLEELSKTKELKQEQVQKIQSKEENNEKVKELEAQLSNWLSAKREAEQSGTLLTQEAFILILEHLSENQDTVALLSQDHNSLYELAKLLQNRVNGQLRKKDQPWNGLNLKHQAQSEQHKEVEVVQPLKQESPQPQEIVETHKEQTHQQEQYVLIKSSPKKSFQEEARTQVHQTLDQQTNQHSDNTQQQENTNLESNTNQPQEQQQQPDQQENQEKTHQNREGHRQHHQNDNQRKGYKKNYHYDNNYDRRNNGDDHKNRPYRGNRQYHNRDRQQKEEWQEKKEVAEQQQDNQSQHSSDEEYITIERRQKKPQHKPQRGGNRNRQQRQGDTQQNVNVEQ
ncbi:unnamed protein product [Paramecium octaurelia]|uniref:Uncharacterized protein n=1 Tax=Paramecium octaurelia TaxID=43137 RepID=A0A8S1SFV7_PAROT|nr:unnamed protein product [Paramecium octaurelia]